ncbi:jg24183, partial [Pararge aegeria aegeria]
DWEKIRQQNEAEQRDEIRAMYKLREQEIISQLMQLESKQYDMEQENQTLRDKLEEYQRREKEDAETIAETITKTVEMPGIESEVQAHLPLHSQDLPEKPHSPQPLPRRETPVPASPSTNEKTPSRFYRPFQEYPTKCV